MPLVMLLDIFYSVDLDFILNIWSLNSVLILIFSSIYFIQIRIYKNFIFNPNVSDLLNMISNTLLGLPFELLDISKEISFHQSFQKQFLVFTASLHILCHLSKAFLLEQKINF